MILNYKLNWKCIHSAFLISLLISLNSQKWILLLGEPHKKAKHWLFFNILKSQTRKISHPSRYTFLEKIQLDSYNQKFIILKASSGIINLSRKKYRDLNENFQQIASSYTDSNLLSYIRSLAH